MITLYTRSEAETIAFGECVGKVLKQGDVIALKGDLGAGKTHLVQGAAKQMGITSPVVSPTFSLMNVYDHVPPLHHFDFYRLEEEYELDSIDPEEYWETGISFVEWSEKFPHRLPDDAAVITIKNTGDTQREITVEADESRWKDLLKEVEGYALGH